MFRPLFALFFTPFLIPLLAAQDAPANPFTAAAAQVVHEILARAGSPAYVTLAVENRSSLDSNALAQARHAIEAGLSAANVRLVKPERALAEITVTIAENPQGLLWVAEVRQGPTVQLVMLPSPRPETLNNTRADLLSIRRTLVFTEDDSEPILDFAVTGPNAATLIVVNPERMATYSRVAAGWRFAASLPIRHSRSWPRDVRAHLFLQASRFDLFLPGVQCGGGIQQNGAPSDLQCSETDDPWMLKANTARGFYTGSRNYFTGVINASGADQSVAPFYSAATVGDPNPVWVFAGTDGGARMYNALNQPPRVFAGWGSDVAGVHSACGSQWQLLVSRPGDRTQEDAIQAMEISNREVAPVSAPIALPGPVTAMWRNTDGNSVNVVIENLSNGRYEASTLTITCNR